MPAGFIQAPSGVTALPSRRRYTCWSGAVHPGAVGFPGQETRSGLCCVSYPRAAADI